MKPAVANRPIEQFETEVTLPEWQLEPDEESYFGEPDNGMFVDEDGNPLEHGRADRSRRRRARPPATIAGRAPPQLDDRSTASPAATPTAPTVTPRSSSTRTAIDRATGAARPPRDPPPRATPRSAIRTTARTSEARRRARAARRAPASGSRRTARATSAWKAGAWFMWTRCATSCATVARRTAAGREDQPPAVADRARSTRSCPSARADRRPRPALTVTPALRGIFARSRRSAAAAPRASASLDAARDRLARAADSDSRSPSRRTMRGAPCAPVDRQRRRRRTGSSRRGRTAAAAGSRARCAAIQSALPCRPGERRLQRRARAAASAAPARSPDRPTASHAARARGWRTTSIVGTVTARDRPDGARARRHRPR